jgi:uncharacterized protein with ParB-like and HNH nuclease domain
MRLTEHFKRSKLTIRMLRATCFIELYNLFSFTYTNNRLLHYFQSYQIERTTVVVSIILICSKILEGTFIKETVCTYQRW